MSKRLYWILRAVEEIAWVGGFYVVAVQTNIWVSLGISGMLLGYNMSKMRKEYEVQS